MCSATCKLSCLTTLVSFPSTYCNSLQHTATHCNTLQRTILHCKALQRATSHCNALQRTATHCNALQHAAAHCSTLQRNTTLQHTVKQCAVCRKNRVAQPLWSFVPHVSLYYFRSKVTQFGLVVQSRCAVSRVVSLVVCSGSY